MICPICSNTEIKVKGCCGEAKASCSKCFYSWDADVPCSVPVRSLTKEVVNSAVQLLKRPPARILSTKSNLVNFLRPYTEVEE